MSAILISFLNFKPFLGGIGIGPGVTVLTNKNLLSYKHGINTGIYVAVKVLKKMF